MAEQVLRAIIGPTAAGKSAIAMAVAEQVGATIVSADSRQVYRGFNIGTAKPSAADQQRVPHVGLDVVEPTVRYTAAEWVTGARQWRAEAEAQGRAPLLVGGTGFYLRALSAPLFHEPPMDPAQRLALQQVLAAIPTPELTRWVLALDPARATFGRTQLLRAIEVALLTGQRISELFTRDAATPSVTLRYLLVDPGAALAGRIAARVEAMFAAGWRAEVEQLQTTVPPEAPAWLATGYDHVRQWVAGTLTRDAASTAIVIATRQYAKRQRTWFRHQLTGAEVTLLNPTAPDAVAQAMAWYAGGRP